jgi:hypothetical protein
MTEAADQQTGQNTQRRPAGRRTAEIRRRMVYALTTHCRATGLNDRPVRLADASAELPRCGETRPVQLFGQMREHDPCGRMRGDRVYLVS